MLRLTGKTRDVITKLEMLAEAEEGGVLTAAALHEQALVMHLHWREHAATRKITHE